MDNNILTIPLKLVVADPDQPRTEFEPGEMKQLEKSIATQGILVPLALERMEDGKYLVIDGERRFRASTALKLKEVPAIVYPAMTDKERIMTRFHLQEQHSNWSAFDKAKAIANLQTATNMGEQEIANLLGLNIMTIRAYLSLMTISKRSIHTANKHKIPYTYLSEIALAKKSTKEVTLRNDLELALMDKILTRVIQSAHDIPKYKNAIKEVGEAMVKKIINNPLFTGDQALKEAGLAEKIENKNLIAIARRLNHHLVMSQKRGGHKNLLPEETAVLDGLQKTIESYLE